MLAYVLKRLFLMVPTLFGVLLLTFVVIQFVPGGPVEQMVAQLQGRDSGGEGAAAAGAGYRGRQGVDAARVEEIKQLYGFDKPPSERFLQMLAQFARFDLGKSFYYPKDVWSLIKEKLPVSISLGLWGFFLSYLISVPLGIAKAVRAGTRFDTLTSVIVLTGYAIPGFVLGVALLVIFGAAPVVPAAWSHLRQLGAAQLGGTHHGLPLAHHPASHGERVGLVCRDHHAHQERHARGNPQTVCVDRARQGLE